MTITLIEILAFAGVMFSFYGLLMTNLVEKLRADVFNRTFDTEHKAWKMWEHGKIDLEDAIAAENMGRRIRSKHSFASMLFSLRPLCIEFWYDEEEVKFLNGEIL
ncbi:hypothetical protein [uncultured Bacteroides sp.]|uniref:hypothetical protein n=1 Tax=uncultured Bacteroides sp. TaxID=162156 RepID=UPI00261E1774|nr:hypothetical protein [uncultured Bacteroides sp.]